MGRDTVLGGLALQRDDIVFAYARVDGGFAKSPGEAGPTATVGLNKGDGQTFASPSRATGGLIGDAALGLLPTGSLLFRPTAPDDPVRPNEYNLTTMAVPVPEPAGLVLLGLGAVIVTAAFRRGAAA